MRIKLGLPAEVCWAVGAVIAVAGGHFLLDRAMPEPQIANNLGAVALIIQTHVPQLIRYSALA